LHARNLARISVFFSGRWFRTLDPSPACGTYLLGTGAFIDGNVIRIEIKVVKVALKSFERWMLFDFCFFPQNVYHRIYLLRQRDLY
jgi:hypothetical protein